MVEETVLAGLDDWVHAGEIAAIVQERNETFTPANIRTHSLGLVAELLVQNLMTAGDVVDDGFRAWEIATGEALERIAERWLQVHESIPTPSSVVWLCNTALGDQLAKAALAAR